MSIDIVMNGTAIARMKIVVFGKGAGVIKRGTMLPIIRKEDNGYWVMPPWGKECLVADFEIEVIEGIYCEDAFAV